MTTKLSVAGSDWRELSSWSKSEIARFVAGKEKDVCVQVEIAGDGVNVLLSTGACPTSGRRGRPARSLEKILIQRWMELGLNEEDFDLGKLIVFLKENDT